MKTDKLPEKPFEYQNFINGKYVNSIGKKVFNRESPSHGSIIGTYQLSNKKDVEEAILIAKNTFKSSTWSGMSGVDREKIIRKAAEIIRIKANKLAYIETLESGKPISQAINEVEWAAAIWDYAASLARHIHGEVNTNVGNEMTAMMQKVPVGVVGRLLPVITRFP